MDVKLWKIIINRISFIKNMTKLYEAHKHKYLKFKDLNKIMFIGIPLLLQ